MELEESKQNLTRWQVPFFSIWTGQAFSLIGSKVAQFALVWWLTKLTGSATVLATASLVALLPDIVLGPLAGAYIDRWNRRVVMIVADGMVALASLWLAYLFWTGAMQVWHVYAIMLARAIGGSFHWPAMQASTSLMVPKKHLARVAGLNQSLNGALSIIAPPVGALMLELLPLYGVMLLDVGTALIAIGPLFFVHIPQPQRSDADAAGLKSSIWADLRQGLDYVWNWPGLVALIAVVMIIKIALTPAFSLLPLLVNKHFLGDAAQLSLLESAAGVGIVLGGFVLSAWGGFKRKIYTSMMGGVILGLGFIVLGLTPGNLFWMAIMSIFFVGLMIPMVDGPITAILQSTVTPEMQGRVFTIMGSLIWLTSPLSLAIAGPISDALGLQVWYLAAGILCSVLGAAGFFYPTIANIEQNQNDRSRVGAQPAAPAIEHIVTQD